MCIRDRRLWAWITIPPSLSCSTRGGLDASCVGTCHLWAARVQHLFLSLIHIFKVNTAGVVPIIFASALLYFPAQIAVFFPGIGWIQAVASALSRGWLNWVLNVVLIVFFAYFYTSMVFNPDDTADNLKKQGGFIPGVRPGRATAAYIKNALNKITLPSAVFLALIAIVPSIIFSFTGNHLIQAFGGTSILIMVGVVLDTVDKLEGQIKMYDYDGFFK